MRLVSEPQLDLDFNADGKKSERSSEVLSLPDGDVVFSPEFFQEDESDSLFQVLMEDTEWSQATMKYYGKPVNIPRLTAWYGDKGASYRYSNISNDPHPWTPTLLYIEKRIEQITNVRFNSVLMNLYRSGNDGVSWHQDNERELGDSPVIASVSFGETRRFQFRHKFRKELPKVEIDLTHGSLLIMKGATQQYWQHQIPKTSKPVAPRINLTFRVIY